MMRLSTSFFAGFALAAGVGLGPLRVTAEPHESALLEAIGDLGRLNGEALACDQTEAVGRAKALMIAYAPPIRRYGAAFEEATRTAFADHLSQKRACRPAAAILQDLERAGVMLRLDTEQMQRE